MNGNIYKSAGVTFGIIIGLILAIALILISNNNRKIKSEYDERQLRVRGDAYRYAFYTVLICEVILFILAFGEFSLPVALFSPATASGRMHTGASTITESAMASFWLLPDC